LEHRFLYHANATGLEGRITVPFDHLIEVQAASALPPTGGYSSARVEHFAFKEMISFESAVTQAVGSFSPEDKAHNTLVTATIEKLNILDQVTADRVVAYLTSKHPESGGQPSIIPLGSSFENLRIAGCPVDVHLDCEVFIELDTYDKVCERLERDKDFRSRLLARQEGLAVPPPRDALLCCLVREIRPHCPELKPKGCTIFVPHFGTVYLAEFLIQPYARTVTMIRVELGCPVRGHATAAIVSGNGQGY
jgi:hypothetical protein